MGEIRSKGVPRRGRGINKSTESGGCVKNSYQMSLTEVQGSTKEFPDIYFYSVEAQFTEERRA